MSKRRILEHLAQRPDVVARPSSEGYPYPHTSTPEDIETFIDEHLEGRGRVGFYTPTPGESMTRWACVDFDAAGSHKVAFDGVIERAVNKLVEALEDENYSPLVEVSASGKGRHVWLLFDDFVPAARARALMLRMLKEAGMLEQNGRPAAGIDLYPKSSQLAEGKVGSLVWAPFWGTKCAALNWTERLGFDVLLNPAPVREPLEYLEGGVGGKQGAGAGGGFDALPEEFCTEMLASIDAAPYDIWVRVVAALKCIYGDDGFALADAWAQTAINYEPQAMLDLWDSLDGGGGVATLVYLAKQEGWDSERFDIWRRNNEPGSGFLRMRTGGKVASLEFNSDYAIAQTALERLGEGRVMLGAEGVFWVYVESKGVWEAIPQTELDACILSFDRVSVGKSQIKMSESKRGSVQALMEREIGVNDAWPEEVPGLAFRNGFLGRNGLEAHSEVHFCRWYVDVEFDACEVNKEFEHFLNSAWANQDVDEAKACRENIQMFAGACLMGVAPRFQKACLLYSPTGNTGKSVMISVIESVFEGAVSRVAPQNLDHEYNRVDLSGVRLNAVYELPLGKFAESANFKEAIDGAPMRARSPYGQPFTLQPRAGHLFSANRLPATNDTSSGFWRRWLIVPMTNVVPPELIDRTLGDRLCASARSASWLYAWAFEGYCKLINRNGFHTSQEAAELIKAWQQVASPYAAFIEDMVSPVHSESDFVSHDEICAEYGKWARKNRVAEPFTKRDLLEYLAQMGFSRTRNGKDRVRGWNIRLIQSGTRVKKY